MLFGKVEFGLGLKTVLLHRFPDLIIENVVPLKIVLGLILGYGVKPPGRVIGEPLCCPGFGSF
ncbi:hypothetical protein D3C87_2108590 [compost metagenome]